MSKRWALLFAILIFQIGQARAEDLTPIEPTTPPGELRVTAPAAATTPQTPITPAPAAVTQPTAPANAANAPKASEPGGAAVLNLDGFLKQMRGEQNGNQNTSIPGVRDELRESAQSCRDSADTARRTCLEELSPVIQGAASTGSTMISSLMAAGGTQTACSDFGKAMDGIQKAMTAYNGACGALKAVCVQKCNAGKEKAQSLTTSKCTAEAEKLTDTTQRQQEIEKCKNNAQAANTALTQAHAACNDYQKNLVAGGVALGGILASMMNSNKCQNQVATTNCTTNPTAAGCKKVVDCNLAENAAHPQCICEKNPRAPGCAGSRLSSDTLSSPSDIAAPTDSPAGSTVGSPASNDAPQYGENGTENSPSKIPASPGGGGTGELSSKNAGTDNPRVGAGSGLRTDILSGDGGSSGSFSSRGGGYDDGTGKYGAYLPKNSDGARGLAGKLSDTGQVTGSTGPSNWEKVRMRYTDNKQSLLNK